MTQLLLFDEPASPSIPTVVRADKEFSGNAGPQSRDRQPSRAADPGMHRMGDLARLVLLRYEMVAARRAKRLAAQTAPAGATC